MHKNNEVMSSPVSFDLVFPKAYPHLGLSGVFRYQPEDFHVAERLGFQPSGAGEHWLVHIEKVGQNTHWVAEQLAQFCGLSPTVVGYCGRKDRHAITQQWFSLYAPKQSVKDIDWSNLNIEGVNLLSFSRHTKKLRLGSHQSNEFVIRLRKVKQHNEDLSAHKQESITEEIKSRMNKGIPNYFGEQRFGRNQSNLMDADKWFLQKRKPHPKRRSMVMSAARSYLFNLFLGERIKLNNWQKGIAGDVLAGELPTGPLWGRGRSLSSETCSAIETTAFETLSEWQRGLEYCGLKQERRDLILFPKKIQVNWEDKDMILSFSLPVGTFATAVLAELIELMPQEI